MKAVVTGGSGFVGRALVADLLKNGWDVDCLSRRAPGSTGSLTYRRADLCDPDGMADALRACGAAEALFHLAAALPTHRPVPDGGLYVRANEIASMRLFDAAL